MRIASFNYSEVGDTEMTVERGRSGKHVINLKGRRRKLSLKRSYIIASIGENPSQQRLANCYKVNVGIIIFMGNTPHQSGQFNMDCE